MAAARQASRGRPPSEVDPGDAHLLGQESSDPIVAGRYRVVRRIGRGGMGIVYLVEHMVLRKTFAMKLIPHNDLSHPEAIERFLREARAVSMIDHPGVVRVTDFGHAQSGAPFLVMEYLVGRDLTLHLRDGGPFPAERARHVGLQLCDALYAVHRAGIVHRDIKPGNVFLAEEASRRDVVKLLDFGIARLHNAPDPEANRLTLAGTILGTPDYVAPETVRSEEVDHRADIYSVGCVLYELLAGGAPFKSASVHEVLWKHVFEAPKPVSLAAPDPRAVPPRLAQVVTRALAKDPGDRYQTMADMRDALADVWDDGEAGWRFEERPVHRRQPVAAFASAEDPLRRARRHLDAGDLEGALVEAEHAVAAAGGVDAPELLRDAEILARIYGMRLGDVSRLVHLAQTPSELDPRTAYLLSRVEEGISLRDLLDVSGMPRLEALRRIALLLTSNALQADE